LGTPAELSLHIGFIDIGLLQLKEKVLRRNKKRKEEGKYEKKEEEGKHSRKRKEMAGTTEKEEDGKHKRE
jgi:hypothetical protein